MSLAIVNSPSGYYLLPSAHPLDDSDLIIQPSAPPLVDSERLPRPSAPPLEVEYVSLPRLPALLLRLPKKLDDVPKEAFCRILFYCNLRDEVALSFVSKKIRLLVLKTTKQKALFRLISEIFRIAPNVSLQCRLWDRLSYPVRNIEMMPLIGTPLALARCISGLSASMLFGIAQRAHLKAANGSESVFCRELALYKHKICKDYTRRSLRETFLGAIFTIPCVGLFYDNWTRTERHMSPIHLHAIHMLRETIRNLNWLKLIKTGLVDVIPPSHKNITFINQLAQVIQSTSQLTIRGVSPQDQLNVFSNPIIPTHHIYPFQEIYNEILEKSKLIDRISKNVKKLLITHSIEGV